jgi:TolB-like protein
MIGKTIHHYKILDKIGEGGMGVVYKALDTRLDRTVALKFMPPDVSRDAVTKERFIREAQTIAALDHPNLCTIHAIEETGDGRLFIAMACYEGETLERKIEKGPLDLVAAVGIALEIARGMSSAHAKGIVHRDIKPSNVFLVTDGRVKVVDFGLAKWFGRTSLTRTGVTLGTSSYMSPEQARGEEVDSKTDIWALGVVLYEMLAGRPPFTGDYEQAVLYAVLNEDPAPLAELRPDAPGGLVQIVERAMAKDRKDRYASARDVIDDLTTVRDGLVSAGAKASAADAGTVPSIAVLPFANLSPEPENEYFGDGLAEELINALARLEGVRVAARTSAFQFRERGADVRAIAKQLNVKSILEGSVRRSGDKLRVAAQLIDAEDGYHIWSDRYERRVEDIFAIQDEITRAIVDELKIKLKGDAKTPLVKRYTDNIEAYHLYLKGRYFWNRLSADAWDKCVECYQSAIEMDPEFAPAYAGLSIYHQSLAVWGDVRPSTAFPLSKQYARGALVLDDSIGDAHGSLATIHFLYDWDMAAAEREFERTGELDPSAAIHHVNYAIFQLIQKRYEEVWAAAKRAVELDPLSTVIQTWVAMLPTYTGRPLDSVKRLRQVIELDPTYWQPYHHMAVAHLAVSDFAEAAIQAEKAVELSGGASVAMQYLAVADYRAGKTAKGDEVLRKLEEKAARAWVSPMVFLWIHVARGDEDEAYRHLERAVAERDPWLLFYGIMPGTIRPRNPKFDDLVASTGLPV